MFQFSGFALVQHTFSMLGSPIRKSADQTVCAGPRSLSQLIASFIASESLGIPRVPLFTFSLLIDRSICCSRRLLYGFFFQYVKELRPRRRAGAGGE